MKKVVPSPMTSQMLEKLIAARGLSPAKLLPIGQLRIATIPSQAEIVACRSVPLASPEQLADWIRPAPVLIAA